MYNGEIISFRISKIASFKNVADALEVVNVKDCRCLGSVRDLDIDKECGRILALIVPGPGKYLGCFCRDSEFFIPWAKVIRIGPDIILVEFDEKEMKHRIKG